MLLGSQGYTAKSSAKNGVGSVLENGSDAANYEIFEAVDGQWGVRLVAANGEVIARGETYVTKSNATRAVKRMAEILSGKVSITE